MWLQRVFPHISLRSPIFSYVPSHSPMLSYIPAHSPILSYIPSHSPIFSYIPSHSPIFSYIPSHLPISASLFNFLCGFREKVVMQSLLQAAAQVVDCIFFILCINTFDINNIIIQVCCLCLCHTYGVRMQPTWISSISRIFFLLPPSSVLKYA
jgi:hypothetical protein